MRKPFRRHTSTIIFSVLAHAASVGIALGQVADRARAPEGEPTFQITPFSAIGDDLAPGGGAAFTFTLRPNLRLEAESSLGTDAARSSLSLLYDLPRWGCCAIYVAGGFGVQRDEVPGSDIFVRGKKTEAAVNVGAGMSVPFAKRLAYRFDFRWYNPDNEWPESWRVYNGVSFAWRK